MKTRTFKTVLTALLALMMVSAMCATAAAELPAKFDLRDVDGVNYVSSIKDQGGCGACYAFAVVGALETYLMTQNEPELDLSEEQAKECTGYGCIGGSHESVMSLFVNIGSVLEADDPYHDYDTQCNQNTPVVRITGWKELSSGDRDEIKEYIYEYGPVISSVYAHSIVIVGWDDTCPYSGGDGVWIVKNSYGAYNAYDGFCHCVYGSGYIEDNVVAITGYEYCNEDVKIITHADDGKSGKGYHPNDSAWGMSLLEVEAGDGITRILFDTTGETSDVDFYIYDGYDGTSLGNLLYRSTDMSYEVPGLYYMDIDYPLVFDVDTEIVVVGHFVNTVPQWNLGGFCPVATEFLGQVSGKTYISPTGASGSWNTPPGGDVSFRLRVDTNFTQPPMTTQLILDYAVSGKYNIAADINNDGSVTSLDALLFLQTGDINGNDVVTNADAIYLSKHVAGNAGYETIYADGDINSNGMVTSADAIYLAKHVAGMSGYETLYP